MSMISIGDSVLWCGGFGRHAARLVEVIRLDINLNPSDPLSEHMTSVELVEFERFPDSLFVTIRTPEGREHWAYPHQISQKNTQNPDISTGPGPIENEGGNGNG